MRIFDAHTGIGYNAHMRRRLFKRRADRTAAKRATNVSIRSDLLDAAREAGVNLSATLERALAEELANVQRARWREENREAIDAYNEYVSAHGAFSDGVRSF
jgi:antitoxin CcdA